MTSCVNFAKRGIKTLNSKLFTLASKPIKELFSRSRLTTNELCLIWELGDLDKGTSEELINNSTVLNSLGLDSNPLLYNINSYKKMEI